MTTLKHIIGKSTLFEGITVPRLLEEWVRAPEAGCKRDVVLHFNGNQITATLRRTANARGHVQIKYESARCAAFRQWLIALFGTNANALNGEYIELFKVNTDEYEVKAFPLEQQSENRLVIDQWLLHGLSERELWNIAPIREIIALCLAREFLRERVFGLAADLRRKAGGDFRRTQKKPPKPNVLAVFSSTKDGWTSGIRTQKRTPHPLKTQQKPCVATSRNDHVLTPR